MIALNAPSYSPRRVLIIKPMRNRGHRACAAGAGEIAPPLAASGVELAGHTGFRGIGKGTSPFE